MPSCHFCSYLAKDWNQLWITTDSADQDADFSPHARILTKISGTGNPDGTGTAFIFNDPATRTEMSEPFAEFIKAFEQMASDNSGDLFIQVVHFNDKVNAGGRSEGGTSTSVIKDSFLTDVVNDPSNQFTNLEDINSFFEQATGFDFVIFFNKFIGGKGKWGGINITADELSAIRFMNIWDNMVPTLGVPSINLIQFLCLQCAINNETGGKMNIPSETVGIKIIRALSIRTVQLQRTISLIILQKYRTIQRLIINWYLSCSIVLILSARTER